MIKEYDQIHIITSLSKGGAEKMLYKLLKYSSNKKTLVICLLDNDYYSHKLKILKIETIHLNLTKKNFIQKIFIFVKILKYNSKSVIGWMYHGNLSATIFYLCKFLIFRKIRLYWNIRQTLYNINNEKKFTILVIKLNKILSFIPNKIIYNSKLSIIHHKNQGFNQNKSLFIPNGFEIKISNNKYPDNLKKKLHISDSDIIISHINRFHPMKNHKLAIDVADTILNKYKNIKFIFCGKDISLNNDNFTKLIKLDKHKLNRCYFLDDIDEVDQLLNFTNLFLLTSSWGEGFPNIIGEAMLNECNIISTNVGDVKEILDKNDFIVPINNKDEIIKNIDILISTGKIFKKNKKAKDIIIENFNIHNIAKQFNQVI